MEEREQRRMRGVAAMERENENDLQVPLERVRDPRPKQDTPYASGSSISLLPFLFNLSFCVSVLSASYQSAFDIFNWNFMKIYSILN